jgi:competence ComEA-like helix-hairpin-helix protein
MKRILKPILGLLITCLIIRLLIEYLRPVRVKLEERVSPPPPHPEPPLPPSAPSLPSTPAEPERLNLNQADGPALSTLPGVGPALAEHIMTHRQRVGPFASLDDLTRVRGIGPVLVERLRPLVTLD